MTPHLTPEQFVDLAEDVQPESAVPHLAACEACRTELADLRAMMSAAAEPGVDVVPEPSPLYWNQLSARVRDGVAQQPPSWRERLMQLLVPALGAALATAILAVALSDRAADAPAIPSSPIVSGEATLVPERTPSLPPLAPLGAADDPQLAVVAAVATTVDWNAWDEMMDEVAMSTADTSDAVASALTQDEQRELQRLLTEAIAQPGAREKLS
jgi:hypothetical protein